MELPKLSELHFDTKVLDKGYVRLMNLSGPFRRPGEVFDASDRDPAQAARMSFDAMGLRSEAEDIKLADYLMRNWHTSPFEMIECWFIMKLPIFVARQFVRHRTAGLNEVSGRYVQLPADWYIPEVVGGKAKSAKQGQEDNLSEALQQEFKDELSAQCFGSYKLYEDFLDVGVAPEHARMFLHLNHYTVWMWKQDLHNILHFCSLRDHSHAQVEAQVYGQAVVAHLRRHLPRTMDLYDKYRKRP